MVNNMDSVPGKRPNGVWQACFSEKFVTGRGRKLQIMCSAKLRAKEFEQRFNQGKLCIENQLTKNKSERTGGKVSGTAHLSTSYFTKTHDVGASKTMLDTSNPDSRTNSPLRRGVLGYMNRIQTNSNGDKHEKSSQKSCTLTSKSDERDLLNNVQYQFTDSETEQMGNNSADEGTTFVRDEAKLSIKDFKPVPSTPEENKHARPMRFQQSKSTNSEPQDYRYASKNLKKVNNLPREKEEKAARVNQDHFKKTTSAMMNGNITSSLCDEKLSVYRTIRAPTSGAGVLKNQEMSAQEGWKDWTDVVVAPPVASSEESSCFVEENDDLSDVLVDKYVHGWNHLEKIGSQGPKDPPTKHSLSPEKLLKMTKAKSTTNDFTFKMPPGTVSQPSKKGKDKYGGYEIEAVSHMGWGNPSDANTNWYEDGCAAWSCNDGGPVWG